MTKNEFICTRQHCDQRTVEGGGRMIARGIFFVSISIGAAFLGVWAAEREPPYVLENGVVLPNPAIHGEPIRLQSDVIVSRTGCHGVFQRTITDAGGFPWVFPPTPTQFNDLPPGKYRVAAPIPYTLPMAIASGEACASTETTFYCNPLHKLWPIKVHTACVKFTVAPR